MRGTRISLLCLSVGLTLLLAPFTIQTAAAQDYTQGMSYVSSSSSLSWFKPSGFTSAYVILHYVRPGLSQQNVNMAWNGGTARWEFTVNGLAAGNVVSYWFTYEKLGAQFDSPAFAYTHSSSPTATPTNPSATATATSGASSTPPPATPTNTPTATSTTPPSATATSTTATATPTTSSGGCATCTTKRLKIINGCSQPIWIQYHTGFNGGTLNAPNRHQLPSVGSFIEYDIPDKGLAGVRFWPGMGCDSGGHNCQIGASGGPASLGFTCPAGIGCAPPIDSKFEGTFGCMPSIPSASCQANPSNGTPLGRNDWWNTSMVDGYTLPVHVRVIGNCPVGPQADNPGGPVGGVVNCSSLRFADCPRAENLSTNGQFSSSPGSPAGTTLQSQDLLLKRPNADGSPSSVTAGCISPSAKLTSAQWQSLPKPPFTGTTYAPTDAQAQWYACPSPPITPTQCMAGPAASTQYTNMIHSKCNNTYAYAYDDVAGLLACPAATSLRYEVTFYCPQ